MNDYLITTDSTRHAYSCFFRFEGQEYLADLCFLDNTTECMIFKSKDHQITLENADGVYCKRDIPFSEEALLECIEEFVLDNDGEL